MTEITGIVELFDVKTSVCQITRKLFLIFKKYFLILKLEDFETK